MISDVRAKRRIRPADGVPNQVSSLLEQGTAALGDAMQKRSAQSEAEALSGKRTAQASGQAAALEAAAAAPGYEYEYKDPERHGEGRFVGPMAQDLESTPVGRTVVEDTPDGKQIDTSRLSLVNTAAVSEQQREIEELRRQVAALGGARG
jgi:hypothetical protein